MAETVLAAMLAYSECGGGDAVNGTSNDGSPGSD